MKVLNIKFRMKGRNHLLRKAKCQMIIISQVYNTLFFSNFIPDSKNVDKHNYIYRLNVTLQFVNNEFKNVTNNLSKYCIKIGNNLLSIKCCTRKY